MVQAANVNVGLNLEYASFVSGGDQARRAMNSNLAAIQRESAKTAAALGKVPDSLKGFGSANDNLKRSNDKLKHFGNVAQQAGYQVGDFFVQLSSGTSALTAFIQQGSQIAGAFGPAGAIIGALGAAAGALATAFLRSGNEAEAMGRKVDGATEAMRRLTKAQNDSAAQARKLLQEQVPKFTGGKLQTPTLEELEGTAEQSLGRQQLATEARLTSSNFASAVALKRQGEIEREIELEKELEKQLADSLAATKSDREQAAAAAKAQANQNAALIARMDEEVAASARLAEANGKGAYALELVNIENKKQNDLIEKTKGLKGEELEHQKQNIELLAQRARLQAAINTATPTGASVTQRQAETSSLEQYERDAPEILQAKIATEQKAADKLADIYAQPFKDLATNISRTLSSGIQDALSGEFDFTTFAEGFGDIFADTLASSISAALTPALTGAATSFGDLITSAFSTAATGAGAAGAAGAGGTAGTAGLTYGGAALGGAAAGGIAGGLYGAYAPGMKPGNFAGVGGAVGGAGGAALGMFLMPANPLLGAAIGGTAGGLLGSFTGGLFGGQNNLGNDRSAQAYRPGRGLTYSDASFSAENRQVTQGIIDQLTVLQEALETAGGAIGDFGLRLEAGNKTGITVNGKKYPDAQAALAASLEVLIGSTTALPASQQTVLANTKAKDAQGIMADLGVAQQFDQLTFKGTELTRQLVALDAEMAAFGKRAQALGLDINAVAAAHEEQRQALIDAQAAEQNQIRAAIDALAPSGNALEIQLALLNDQVQALAVAATDAGLPLEQLAAAHQRAAAQLISANQQLQASLALQVSALDPATDQLSLALAQLNQEVQSLAAQILASGGSLDDLAAAHQRAGAALVAQHNEARRLQDQQAKDEQRRLHEQIKAQQAQERAEAAARHDQIVSFQAQVALLEAVPMEATLINIREQFRKLIEQGKALGLTAQSEAQIRAAQARAETAARNSYISARAEEIRNFQQQSLLLEASPLDAALIQIRERFREMIEQGKAIGLQPANVAQLQAAQGRAEATARTRAWLDQEAFTLQLRGMGAASNDAALQLAQLQMDFHELTISATALGVPLNLVYEAQGRATQALKDQLILQKQEVRDQIAAAGGGTSSLADKLRILDVEMRQLALAAAGVGIPLSEVTAAHVKAAQRIRDEWAEMLADMQKQLRDASQGILEAQRSAAGAIDQFLNPFKEALSSRGIGQGVYSGASLTESGLKEFREALKEARTGDTQALGSLVGIGTGAIQQARATFGSTAQFAEVFREIEAGLREQQGAVEAKRDELLQQIGTYQRETISEIVRLRVQAIADLRADFQKLSRDLIVAVEGNA